MNRLLIARNIQPLTRHRYRQIFTFPVNKYYKKAGFNFQIEEFEKPALEFIEIYQKELINADLFPDVKRILEFYKASEYHQSILSAMEHDSLIRSLENKGRSARQQRTLLWESAEPILERSKALRSMRSGGRHDEKISTRYGSCLPGPGHRGFRFR